MAVNHGIRSKKLESIRLDKFQCHKQGPTRGVLSPALFKLRNGEGIIFYNRTHCGADRPYGSL